jgi:undecaprenyl-diphosphatase
MEKLLEFFKYIILGLVQGITEPLPISSSGHMVIFNEIFGEILPEEAMLNFGIVVNFASFFAIVFYYRNLLKEIITGSWNFVFRKDNSRKKDFTYLLYIIIATIPAVIIGLVIMIFSLDAFFTNILCVGISLFITGNLLLYIHGMAPSAKREEVTLKDSILMGSAQAIGLLPGISRSGITTSFGVANKLSLAPALRFSFMLYLPASLGAAILGLYRLVAAENTTGNTGFLFGYLGAFFASLFATYAALKLFFRLVKKQNLKYFGYYCIAVSVIVIVLIAVGVFSWK